MDEKSVLLWSFFILTIVVNGQPSIPSDLPRYFTLYENTTIGTEIFTLRGVDTSAGNLVFSTSTPDTATLVRLGSTVVSSVRNQWTCLVFLNSALDRDNSPSTRQLNFGLANEQLQLQVRILMIINDVNDNPPTFVGLPYRTSIREDLHVGSSVFKVSATDPDYNRGFDFRFSMKSVIVGDNQTFLLDNLGSITLNKPLDYERQSFYHYNVSVKDNGDPPCPGTTCQCKGLPEICDPGPVDLFITIIDTQDTPPVFERLPYMGKVAENATVGYSILQVIAADGDRGVSEPNSILFSFTGGDFSPFAIDQINGIITVGTHLDADSDNVRENGGLYVFTVTATEVPPNGSIATYNPNNQSSTQVSITVTDVNDNPPVFTERNFTAVVLENTPSGVPITTTSAIEVYDRDQGINSRFWVYLEKDGVPYLDFDTIPKQNSVIQGRSTITIRVVNSSVLDYETTKTIIFKIIARENNTDPNISKSSEATVILEIEDTNDNNPYFPSQQTVFNVSEDALVGHVIANITATDDDSGDFGQIIFSLEDSGHNGEFNISEGGQIQVAQPLDREQSSLYSLSVVAADSPSAPTSQRRRSTLHIEISVTDVNDHAPVWTQFIPYISILESTIVGTEITEMRAIDLDYGNNAQIEYFISPGTNGSELFSVQTISEKAVITVRQSLIDHVGLIFVKVIAVDMGSPPLNATVALSIFVIDENQNRPVFVRPDQNAYDEKAGLLPEIIVDEEQPVGSVLYTLLGTDKDMGQNGLVEYYLNPTTNRDYEYFTVARVSGELQSASRLDREKKEVYEIQVRAEDQGQPAPLSTTLTMRIKLRDIDDNEPSYKGVIMPQVLHVIEEKNNAYIGQIQSAFDADSYPNNLTCYYLYGNCTDGLYLDKYNRTLFLTGKVDRETISSLSTVIKASENCNLTNDFYISVANISYTTVPMLNSIPISYNSSDDTQLWVEVLVDDINDNPPQFLYHEFSTSAIFDVDIGTEIMSLATSVSDKDTPTNSRNMFKLVSTTPELETGETLDTYKTPFIISVNGSIITNIRFRSDLLGYFLLRVLVFDNDGLNDAASVKVYLISNLQRIKLVFEKLPNQVEALKNSFVKKLSDILNIDIVIDKIQSHTNQDGTRDPTRTDAYIHGRYRDTGKVVPATDLWQSLDFSHAARSLLFGNGVTEAQPLTDEKKDNEAEDLKRIFAILISIMAVIVIVLFLVLIHLVRLYRRRLKAATVPYESSNKKEIFEHPGTNKYFAAKNPLFGKEITPAHIDEDKISHNSLDVNEVDEQSSTSKSLPQDTHEEQEMVLQITEPLELTFDKNEKLSSHLDQVLQAYSNAAYENGSDTEDTFDNYGRDKGNHFGSASSGYSVRSLTPGIDFQEGITRFSDDNMSNDSHLLTKNIHTHLEHTDI